MPVSLKDKVVIVIGASSGVGRATAILMAREGAKVMASARRQDRLLALRNEAAADGLALDIFAADASDATQMERLAAATRARFGNANIVVYATGTNTPDRSLERLKPAIWNELIATNLNGAYYATHAVLPAMRAASDGHIIFVASISGHTPDISGAAYQASKRGMIGLAHAIRFEEKGNGIRTTVICPGLIDTEILEKRPVKPSPELLAKALLPEQVAEAIVACARMHPQGTITEMTLAPTAI
jgi:NADP-dependent 3-hydroxy acid dehydrogenase YdfG